MFFKCTTLQSQADASHLECDYIITLDDHAHGGSAAGASTLGSAPTGTASTVVRMALLPCQYLVLHRTMLHRLSGTGIVSGINDCAANLGTTFANKVLLSLTTV